MAATSRCYVTQARSVIHDGSNCLHAMVGETTRDIGDHLRLRSNFTAVLHKTVDPGDARLRPLNRDGAGVDVLMFSVSRCHSPVIRHQRWILDTGGHLTLVPGPGHHHWPPGDHILTHVSKLLSSIVLVSSLSIT